VTILGRNGCNFTRRFPTISAPVLGLPVRSAISDGELVAPGAQGQPDFLALLHARHLRVRVGGSDLLELQGRDLRACWGSRLAVAPW